MRRAGDFVLEEGTREDIVREERKRTKLQRLSRGGWVGGWLGEEAEKTLHLIACEQVLHLGEVREVTRKQRLHIWHSTALLRLILSCRWERKVRGKTQNKDSLCSRFLQLEFSVRSRRG